MSIRLEIVVTYRPDIEPTERLEAANFRERALDLAIAEIDEKTDLNIERAKHRPVNRLGLCDQDSIDPERVYGQMCETEIRPSTDCLTLWDR